MLREFEMCLRTALELLALFILCVHIIKIFTDYKEEMPTNIGNDHGVQIDLKDELRNSLNKGYFKSPLDQDIIN